MTLMIDTGSSDFWVHGPKSPNANGTNAVQILTGQTFSIDYQATQGLYVRGPVVSTEVAIGGVSVPNMPVGLAAEMDFGYPLDGFLGLGFQGINTVRPTPQPTFMIAAQPQLQLPIFSLNLNPNPESSTLSFGTIDTTKYKGTLMTAPVNNATYSSWVVEAVTLTSGTASITQPMLFDSGGSDTTTASPDFVRAYWAQVPASMNITLGNDDGSNDVMWIFPCAATLPDLYISIGGAGGSNTPVTIAGSKFNGGEFPNVGG
ncbi:MAG: hypothetical protein Q9225_007905, partial [Loekoesia sp. 1 TL-2023]